MLLGQRAIGSLTATSLLPLLYDSSVIHLIVFEIPFVVEVRS